MIEAGLLFRHADLQRRQTIEGILQFFNHFKFSLLLMFFESFSFTFQKAFAFQ